MDAERLAGLTEQELYAELGRQLSPSAGFGLDDLSFMAGRGKAWFNEHLPELRERICGHVDEVGDVLVDASTIAAAVSEVANGTTGLIVALLVAKQGLAVFCRNHGR